MELHTYAISYDGKTVKARGENAFDAVCRYADRDPFGQGPIFHDVGINMVDADTRGEKWGEFWAPAGDGAKTLISAERIR